MKEHDKHDRWWELKTFGYLPPREENSIIFYVLLGIIVLTLSYIATFYFK
jgi:hypothetical protein